MRIVIAAVLYFLAMGGVHAECTKRVVVSEKGDDGVTTGIVISSAQFKQAPKWFPGEGDPPLSISRAIEIADQWGQAAYRNFDSVQIDSVGLDQYGCPGDTKYWYYLVRFRTIKDGTPFFGGNFVAILFDGKLISPGRLADAP